MAALLAVFVLAVVILALNLGRQQLTLEDQQLALEDQHEDFEEQIEELQSAEQVRAELVDEIRDELERQGIEVHVTENNSVLSIPNEQLGFAASEYEISEQYENVTLAIGTAVSQAIQKDERFEHLDTVFVEGHTDNMAFDGLEGTGNWGLSTFRAISLWSLWEDQLPADDRLSQLRSAHGDNLFSVSGYAETRPATEEQDDDAQRAANRRIDIRFTIVRPSSDDMEDLSEQFTREEEG
ncbi:OmpA/MotB family protein [Nesterenkonia suensis]